MSTFFYFQAQDAASAATSAVSSVASAATNAASSAATAATSAASAATSGIWHEEDVTDSGVVTEEETNIDANVEEKEEVETVPKEEKFINAIENGEISVFMDMLYRKDELDLDIDNIKDANGITPLRLAISKGYSGMFNFLIV